MPLEDLDDEPETPLLLWLDEKFPYDVPAEKYMESVVAMAGRIIEVSDSAKELAGTKYWDPREDVCVGFNANAETGYWNFGVAFRILKRSEVRNIRQQKMRRPSWDLGGVRQQFLENTDIPDVVLHPAIMRMSLEERRHLFKAIVGVELVNSMGGMNRQNEELMQDVKNFMRGVYENLLKGNVHTSFAMQEGLAPEPSRRRTKKK